MSREEVKQFGIAVVRVFVFAAVPLVTAAVAADGLDALASVEALKALGLAAAIAGARAVYGAFRAGQLPFPSKGV